MLTFASLRRIDQLTVALSLFGYGPNHVITPADFNNLGGNPAAEELAQLGILSNINVGETVGQMVEHLTRDVIAADMLIGRIQRRDVRFAGDVV